ncbi:MAG: iron-only hydrogenase system regulator [Clostridiales bacterium]|jgi:putative iron-only hydrogenase system regulator|nr:iron-only hydrogenase system regulator [Clostridiales bacterium]
MKKIAVISAVLECPHDAQKAFNEVISDNADIVKGRFGIPFQSEDIGIVSVTVVAGMDRIDAITESLDKIPNVSVKTTVSKKEVN